jgi:ethanolamine utilization protein EutN
VWATRKHESLSGRKLVLVAPHHWYAPAHDVGHLVAVDAVGANVGQDVVVCLGHPARRHLGSTSISVDAAVAAIVDHIDLSADAPRNLHAYAPEVRRL